MNAPEQQQQIKDELSQRKLLSKITSIVTDTVGAALSKVLDVKITNADTNLTKEIAENSRKTASRVARAVCPTAAIRTSAVTLGLDKAKVPSSTMRNRYKLELFNNSSNIVYVGDDKVTKTTGIPLRPGKMMPFLVPSSVEIYAIAEASADIRCIEYGLEKG
jgi:hypothetical protein